MSDHQPTFIGERRNAPIWQVFAVVVVLMALASSSFYYGSKHPAPGTSGGAGVSSGTDNSTDYSTSNNQDPYTTSGGANQVQTFIVSNFIGYGSTEVERVIRSSGLFVNTQYTNGDPSINARLNNGCVVIDQSPRAGATVVAGSTIVILADCPLTGQG
jgi:hypothetical protein